MLHEIAKKEELISHKSSGTNIKLYQSDGKANLQEPAYDPKHGLLDRVWWR